MGRFSFESEAVGNTTALSQNTSPKTVNEATIALRNFTWVGFPAHAATSFKVSGGRHACSSSNRHRRTGVWLDARAQAFARRDPSGASHLKAAVYRRYGPPDVIRIEDVPTPDPGRNELLVRVRAASVSAGDARLRSARVPPGFGLVLRLAFGVTGPRKPILGWDFAGEVAAVGSLVSSFASGDRVFGARMGSHAEVRRGVHKQRRGDATQSDIRGRHRPRVRRHDEPDLSERQGEDSTGRAGAHQRRIRRGGYRRGAAGETLRRSSDWVSAVQATRSL